MKRIRIAAGVAWLTALGLASGCAKKTPAPVGTPQAVLVRLAPLAARHPLAAEVARLQQAEAQFAALGRRSLLAAGGGTVVLPALPPLGAVRAVPDVAVRRERERERLQRAAATGLQRYAKGREARRLSVLEQRRLELAAALRAQDAEAERLARLGVEQEIARKLEALAAQRVDLEAALAVLNGQLEQSALTVGPSGDELNAEVAKLDADPLAKGISPRARLTQRKRRFEARLDAINAEADAVTANGAQEIARLAARAEAERNRKIAEQLKNLPQDQALALLQREQQAALQKVLAAEAAEARLENQVMQAAGGADKGNASIGLARLEGQAASVGGSLTEALGRIRRQRERLQQLIDESVAEAVRDTARQHNLAVTLVQGKATTAVSGLPDRTNDFVRWIRWGEPLPAKTGRQ